RAKLVDDVHRNDIHRAAGHVPGDERNTISIDLQMKIIHRTLIRMTYLKNDLSDRHLSFSPHMAKEKCYTLSMIVAVPMPAPIHNVISAVDFPLRSNSSSAVPRIMAPVAPKGWPMAIAPPFTLILSCGMSNTCM